MIIRIHPETAILLAELVKREMERLEQCRKDHVLEPLVVDHLQKRLDRIYGQLTNDEVWFSTEAPRPPSNDPPSDKDR